MSSPRQGSPVELLDRRERAWSPRLRAVSLVAEFDVPDVESEETAIALGRLYPRWKAAGRAERLFTSWPACVAVAVTGVAARDYRQGTFWPRLWAVLGVRGWPEDQSMWGRGFKTAVGALGLPAFPDMPLAHLGPILMHAGIPTFCLEDFFRLIAERRAQEPGLDPEAFLSWATDPGVEHRLDRLDKPARRFLKHGTEFAADFVDRTFDLLDRMREVDPDLDGVSLPPRVRARARELAATGRLDRTEQPGRTTTRAERPRIALDPFGRGVHVVLPAVGETPDGVATWQVTVDGVTSTVRSQAEWVGAAEGAPPTTFSFARPARTVVVALAGLEHRSELDVIDSASPLLVFAEDGRRLPARLPLPPDPVWVVHPQEPGLTVDGPLQVIVEGTLPLGWEGWRLWLIGLDGVRSIELTGNPGSRRAVRGHARPRIATGDPLPGVTTPYGSPVFPGLPEVSVPGTGDAETTWRIEVRRGGHDEVLCARTVTTADGRVVADLWEGLPRPFLGCLEIVVRGPLGRGVKRTLVVAEGLAVRYTPPVRLLGAEGLAAGRAELTAAVGARVDTRSLTFGPDELQRDVEYRAGAETEPFFITPPHVQVMHERAGESPRWRSSTLRIASGVFDEAPGALMVQIPGVDRPPDLHVAVGRRVVQVVPPSGLASGTTARYGLTRIADTIAEHRQADLLLDVGGAVWAARVRPRRLASGAERGPDNVRLVGHVWVEGLTAAIYALHAPWRPPLIAAVDADGTVPLPPELRRAGPLRVLLQMDDPWVPVEWPRWPERYLTVGGDGYYQSADPEETALSGFVAGEGDMPERVEDLSRLWVLVDLARRLWDLQDVPTFLWNCSRPLLDRPADALATLPGLGFGPGGTAHALISSGLAARAVPEPLDEEAARGMWAVAPAAAVLAGGLEDPEVRSAAERQCGRCLDTILQEATDPHVAIGAFGRDVDAMLHMSPQQLEGAWREAQVVPHALLDLDTRATAARQLFDRREEPAVKGFGRIAKQLVDGAPNLLRDARLLEHAQARRHRENKGGWYAIPPASATLALIARLAARGDGRCQAAEQTYRPQWARLAGVAPELVTIDLVLAELLISAEER